MESNFNLKFNYLYRDGSNYKNYGTVIFHNPNNVSVQEIEYIIRGQLLDGEYFIAEKWDLPTLFFKISNSDDHEFHEFESIEVTNNNGHHSIIENFISKIMKT